MPLITWNDTYSVKNAEIDGHHKVLIDLVNQLHEAMRTGKGSQEMGLILDRLADYTMFHFGAEEKLMARHDYSEQYVHKNKHNKFVKQVEDFQANFRSGQLGLSIQMINFLKDWLTSHILGDDKKFGAYLIKKGVQ